MKSVTGIEFFFDYVKLLYYKCHEINWNCDGLCIGSPDWKNKKDNKCFQYAVIAMLNHEDP